jgi:lambda repressor-like predicted transcriptional regulator
MSKGSESTIGLRFPIHGTLESIPWEIVEAHEAQAKENHGGQCLRTLARRGGLSWSEMCAVLEDRPWRSMATVIAQRRMMEIVNAEI